MYYFQHISKICIPEVAFNVNNVRIRKYTVLDITPQRMMQFSFLDVLKFQFSDDKK